MMNVLHATVHFHKLGQRFKHDATGQAHSLDMDIPTLSLEELLDISEMESLLQASEIGVSSPSLFGSRFGPTPTYTPSSSTLGSAFGGSSSGFGSGLGSSSGFGSGFGSSGFGSSK